MTIHGVTHHYGGFICRKCLNEEYGIHLRHSDCKYLPHSRTCPCCGQNRHIVSGLKLKGCIKAIGKKPVHSVSPKAS